MSRHRYECDFCGSECLVEGEEIDSCPICEWKRPEDQSATFEELAAKVRQWASDRQIIQNSTAEAQLEKLEEERQETVSAVKRLASEYALEEVEGTMTDAVDADFYRAIRDELVDGIGDMLVCVINAAAIAKVDPVEALAHAYGEIKDRTGHLGADGIFYKDSA